MYRFPIFFERRFGEIQVIIWTSEVKKLVSWVSWIDFEGRSHWTVLEGSLGRRYIFRISLLFGKILLTHEDKCRLAQLISFLKCKFPLWHLYLRKNNYIQVKSLCISSDYTKYKTHFYRAFLINFQSYLVWNIFPKIKILIYNILL